MISLLLISFVCASQFTQPNAQHGGKTTEEWKNRIIYQVITDRFNRPDGQNYSCDYHNYCGGTYQGLINKLDYIKNMGMNAIWISPILENTEGDYHGYAAVNFYKLNPHFGTDDEFRNFVEECHKRDIWVMVDVVYNHVGCVGTDFGRIYPFNQYYHYHDECTIDYNNQWSIEHCRIE